MAGFLGLELDTLDAFNSIIALVVTSGFVNAVLQYFKLNVCQDARLLQAGVIFLLGLLYGSPFSIILSLIELIIGLADFVAVSNPSFAWLDPNLA
jgi:phosphate/sulfate permease